MTEEANGVMLRDYPDIKDRHGGVELLGIV